MRGFFANGGSRLWVLAVPTADQLEDPTDELQSLEALDVDLVAIPGANGRQQHEALIGHAAEVIARNDLQNGVHRAPANLPVSGAEGVERVLSTSETNALAVDGVLVLRPMRPTSRAATAAPMSFVSVSR